MQFRHLSTLGPPQITTPVFFIALLGSITENTSYQGQSYTAYCFATSPRTTYIWAKRLSPLTRAATVSWSVLRTEHPIAETSSSAPMGPTRPCGNTCSRLSRALGSCPHRTMCLYPSTVRVWSGTRKSWILKSFRCSSLSSVRSTQSLA